MREDDGESPGPTINRRPGVRQGLGIGRAINWLPRSAPTERSRLARTTVRETIGDSRLSAVLP